VPARVSTKAGNCPTNYDQIFDDPARYCTASNKTSSTVTCSINSPLCSMVLKRP
jgi:hypothetical protein